jgi:hypothetical protein
MTFDLHVVVGSKLYDIYIYIYIYIPTLGNYQVIPLYSVNSYYEKLYVVC